MHPAISTGLRPILSETDAGIAMNATLKALATVPTRIAAA